jgi:lipopolysaccharide/colanic/teichoic acid biosynthesis glycosyltransferase
MARPWSAAAKRALDLSLALLLSAALLPLFVLVAIAIKLDSGGPVLFVQKRRGRGGQLVRVFKFRSLTHRAPDPNARYEMRSDDPRITRVGAVLRRTSIDELPQLFNVVAGTMSLVGPRPLVEWESIASMATHPERFWVKPGITGLAQVSGRNAIAWDRRLDKDVEYARGWGIGGDLVILLKTPVVLLCGDGIYADENKPTGGGESES